MRKERFYLQMTCVLAALCFVLAACEGRKMSNSEPTGDTVEVTVNSGATVQADSAAPVEAEAE